jgi:hypothetical protein
MALPMVYGIDPDETWELDFIAEEGRLTLEMLRRHIDRMKADSVADAAALEGAEAKAAALERDLAAHASGAGPVFLLGAIPNGKRAEIQGDSMEVLKLPEGRERLVRDREWAENVVRWGVRGHRNLVSGKSKKPIAFATEDVTWWGEKRQVPSRKTLEAYGPILGDLAILILRSQRFDEAEKNA